MGHWLADPDESGQAVHSAGFAPALASLIFNSLCRFTTANALGRYGQQQKIKKSLTNVDND